MLCPIGFWIVLASLSFVSRYIFLNFLSNFQWSIDSLVMYCLASMCMCQEIQSFFFFFSYFVQKVLPLKENHSDRVLTMIVLSRTAFYILPLWCVFRSHPDILQPWLLSMGMLRDHATYHFNSLRCYFLLPFIVSH